MTTKTASRASKADTPSAAGTATSRRKPSSPHARKLLTEQRQRMIEEAAYYKAHERGFSPGFEIQDWLDAEQEIQSLEARAS